MSKIKFRSFPQNTANYTKTAARESNAAVWRRVGKSFCVKSRSKCKILLRLVLENTGVMSITDRKF